MSSVRTQIYLTRDQRRRLDQRGEREGKTLATLIREAVDGYLVDEPAEADAALASTFGVLPDLTIPSRAEWDRENG
jgi:predicted DNA-binding protein